ncbi:MAG: NUDIX hydrolase [Lachnospiraceae bacterium]|nr:NUDIX hydrolase [Lachnospiraceae bacterium]
MSFVYTMSEEEREYLDSYDITAFDRPSVAADIAILSVMDHGERNNFRKLPRKALKLLMIKRATYPYKDCWALPGGFCRPDEDVYETAKRELYEETNVENVYLSHAGIFGEVGRDPRGWIISNTFLALMDGEKAALRADTDAWEAKWFSVGLVCREIKKEASGDSAELVNEYELSLEHDLSGLCLSAKVREYKEYRDYHEVVRYEIMESENIAFDHAKIILHVLLSLRKNAETDFKTVFDLMPEMFTLNSLQKAFELVLDKELLTANFRRKIMEYVIETDFVAETGGHRPSKLFKRNVERFYK